MQNMKQIFLTVLLGGCLGGLFSGCTDEDMSGKTTEDTLGVRVNLGSRAKLDGTDIEISSLKVYAFWGEEQVGYHELTSSEQEKGSFMMDVVQKTMSEQEMAFYAIADDKVVEYERGQGFSKNMSRADLEQIAFTSVINDEKLPLTCRGEVEITVSGGVENGAEGHEGHLIVNKDKPVELKLSYPAGKLELYFAKGPNVNSDGLVVKSAKVLRNGMREKNYVFPVSLDKLQAVGRYPAGKPINLKNNGVVAKTLENKTTNADDYELLMEGNVFLFENPYGSKDNNVDQPGDNDGNVIEIVYTVNGGNERTKEVYLPAIERGKCYQVLCWVDYRGTVIVTYKVLPWETEDIYELDGGEHPSYNCTLDGDKDNTDVWVSVTDPVLPRDREGAVNFRFKMNSKQQWTPTLRNSVGFKMAVMRVTDEMLMPDSAIDEGEYIITIWPTEDSKVGDVTYLEITSRSLTGEFEPLLINTDKKWGSDSQTLIKIVRVEQQSTK